MSATQEMEIRFELPAQLEFLRPLSAFVRELMERVRPDLARKTSDEIFLVLHEAFTNVCKHAYAKKPDGVVRVDVLLADDQLVLCFEDQGEPFDEAKWKPPDWDALLESGRGVWLMKQLMHEFIYESTPGDKNVLKLVKNLPARDRDALSHHT